MSNKNSIGDWDPNSINTLPFIQEVPSNPIINIPPVFGYTPGPTSLELAKFVPKSGFIMARKNIYHGLVFQLQRDVVLESPKP